MLPLALVGIGVAGWRAIKDRLAFVHSRQGQATIVFGTWLLAAGAFFSVASFFHSCYLVTLGAPIAALAAMGVWGAWSEFRARSRAAWLLPIALVGTALVQAHILGSYPTWSRWLTPLVVAGAALGSAVLLCALVLHRLQQHRLLPRAATGLAIGALLVAPVVWSGGPGGGPQASPNTTSIRQWVQANGTLVPASALGASSGSQTQVYDLSGLQGAVA